MATWASNGGTGPGSMIVDCFLDTNVLVYAALGRFSAPEKHDRARHVMAGTNFGLSSQVLQDFLVISTRIRYALALEPRLAGLSTRGQTLPSIDASSHGRRNSPSANYQLLG